MLFGATKTFQPIRTVIHSKLALYDDINQFCVAMSMPGMWVKTMPDILKPRPLHAHGNFVVGVC